jgi:hypothetical protein
MAFTRKVLGRAMPSFDLSLDELIMLAMILALVVLPSRLKAIGDLVGRLVKSPKD